MRVGIRIDVDTFRGTRHGVPRLLDLFRDRAVSASFFFSVGPDNMGRHLFRLLRPAFFKKMLRSKASSLYGWDILLKGTLWPGPMIGKALGDIIRSASVAGHEVGLHAWDHHAWQARMESMTPVDIRRSLERGFETLAGIIGRPPTCSAAPGWKCNDLTLLEKTRFPFRYNSDCRGGSVFYPLVHGKGLSQPQVPVTLPTYDEVIMRNGISDHAYNDYMLSLLRPDALNILAVHAEVEGLARFSMFEEFLTRARSRGVSFGPLGDLLPGPEGKAFGAMTRRPIRGREGWVSWQSTDEPWTAGGRRS
jgi:undecaprenyl phosphate-alpha-L-ara4FN deformylase